MRAACAVIVRRARVGTESPAAGHRFLSYRCCFVRSPPDAGRPAAQDGCREGSVGKGACRSSTELMVSPRSPCKDGSTEPSSDLTPTRAPWHAHASCTQTYNDNKGKQANKETTSKSFCGITCHVTDNLPCGTLHASREGADRRYFEFWAVTSLSELFIAAVATLKQL